MLLDPTRATRPDAQLSAGPPSPAPPELPRDLRVLARRARGDTADARGLAIILLARRWSPDTVATASGLTREAVVALGTVRRPGTDAGHVADDLVSRPLPRPRPAGE